MTVWDEYQKICNKAEDRHIDMYKMERFEFYERAKSAYAIVATGESAQYANIILMKGVVVDKEKNEDWDYVKIIYFLFEALYTYPNVIFGIKEYRCFIYFFLVLDED